MPPAASVVTLTVLSKAVAWTVKLSKKSKPVLGVFLKIRLKEQEKALSCSSLLLFLVLIFNEHVILF